jgi:hypothetical protein
MVGSIHGGFKESRCLNGYRMAFGLCGHQPPRVCWIAKKKGVAVGFPSIRNIRLVRIIRPCVESMRLYLAKPINPSFGALHWSVKRFSEWAKMRSHGED